MTAVVAALCLSWAVPSPALAQTTTSGTITGQVTDAQGKAIVGAVVLLTNQANNAASPSVTNSAGRYTFTNLDPGTYNLDIKKDGFKEATLKNQNVVVGKSLTLNIPMQVGESTQTVEVTATGAELQTMSATVGETISGSAIALLPSLNRDVNGLTMLQPNTNPDGGVGGADSDQNSFTLDGGGNSNDMDGNNADYTSTTGGAASGVIPTPAESVEQFTVGVSNQSADVNSAAGSSVAIVTKRGTDSVHGSVYDYYLGSYLSANDWGDNQQGNPRSKSHRNRFGAALGGQIIPTWLGGKTYLFGNYEGLRYPKQATYTHQVPTDLLRAGVVQAQYNTNLDPAPWGAYNLNPYSVTVGSTTYAPATCANPNPATKGTTPSVLCDPRGLGLDPVIAQMWKQYMPEPNQTNGGDKHNVLNYRSSIDETTKSNFFVTRMDHDFGAKNHLDVTYHFYFYGGISTAQTDFGGGAPGDTFGKPVALTTRPQLPSMWSAQLTSNISSNVTNNFNYSYLRNFWQWAGSYLKPQTLTGFGPLGGALEIGGESSNALIPYNVNTQRVRTRVWDGIGNTFSDNLTWLHGNHLVSIGGKYTHQRDYHQRNDNGGGIMANNVYQITNGGGIQFNYLPDGVAGGNPFDASADVNTFDNAYAEVLGMVSQPQTLYTRAGAQLNLQPLGTPMFDNSTIPVYNVYFSDAWHLRPSLTLNYGAGYTIEMPPHEELGKQVSLVDAGGNQITESGYISSTERAALSGQNYNPTIGFATVGNVGAGLKYPYNPFYGGFSPRVSLAWNPNISGGLLGWMFGGNRGVLRGGWSRIYGRLNGVDLVLVPLLGTGLGQPVSCIGASSTGACNGPGGVDPTNAFRIGPTGYANPTNPLNPVENFDGMTAPLGAAPTATLAQPYFPGVIQNGAPTTSAGSGEVLDPHFKPNRSDEFDLTFQRQITPAFSTEIGYTGRIIRNEYQAVDLDSVPTMLTAGGQQFQNAFANLYQQIASGAAITPQPFFEKALGGTGTYCTGFSSCTAAVASNEVTNHNIDTTNGNNVYGLWQDLNNADSWTLGRTFASAPTTCTTATAGCPAGGVVSGGGQVSAIYDNSSIGYGNYNSLFWSVNMRNFHGVTAGSNFTWSKAMGTGQVDQATSEFGVTYPFDMHYMYGPQQNSSPVLYNAYAVWSPGPKEQNGLWGRLAHGWSFAPILTWRRQGNTFYGNFGGLEQVANGGQCSSFGEMDCGTGSTIETAIMTGKYTGGSGIVRNSTYGNAAIANGGTGMERFSDPAKVMGEFRPIILGVDTTGQSSYIPGLSVTNVDFSVTKHLNLAERFSTDLNVVATNVFNHFSASSAGENINDAADFGTITGNALDAGSYNRQIEVGLLVRW